MSQGKAKYATIKDIARLANTSTATVSYILNGISSRYVSAELRERVLRAAKELNYNKSAVASSLKGKSRGLVAVLIPQFSNIFFTRVCGSIEDVAYANDIIAMVCDTRDIPELEMDIIEKVVSQRVDGIIIGPTTGGWENTELLRRLNVPFVAIERPFDPVVAGTDDASYFVGSDNFQAGYLAGRHFVENGHKDFALIEWMMNITNVTNRRKGFEQAIKARMEKGGSYVVESSPVLSIEAGYELTKKLLEESRPSAILYGHHRLAQGGVIYLREVGCRVPDDVSVILIGMPVWSQIASPQFTCVKQPEYDIGDIAAKILISQFNGETNSPLLKRRQHIFPCELFCKGSVKNLNA